jgi:hypothetical protein
MAKAMTVPENEGWIPHESGNWPPDAVSATPKSYEVLRRNNQTRDADEISDSYWVNGGVSPRGVVGYRITCPTIRARLLELENTVAALYRIQDREQ